MDADKQLCGLEPDSQYVELAVEVFAMLADATRVRIILALREGELPVNQLAEMVDKSRRPFPSIWQRCASHVW